MARNLELFRDGIAALVPSATVLVGPGVLAEQVALPTICLVPRALSFGIDRFQSRDVLQDVEVYIVAAGGGDWLTHHAAVRDIYDTLIGDLTNSDEPSGFRKLGVVVEWAPGEWVSNAQDDAQGVPDPHAILSFVVQLSEPVVVPPRTIIVPDALQVNGVLHG